MKIKWLISILAIVVILFTSGVIPASADMRELKEFRQPEMATAKWVPDEIMVRFKGDVEHFRVIKVREGKVLEKVKEYSKRLDVDYAEPNYYAHALWEPNDPDYRYQWHLDNDGYGGIRMEEAWGIETGSADVVVAVVDTGVSYENYENGWQRYYLAPDLANTVFVPGYDFVENDTHPNDDNSHGTHVTGTIAQSTDNGMGVAGVAFNTAIMPVKVLNRSGSGTYTNVANGIIWATDHGANVINLSLGGPSPSRVLENAVKYAYDHGVTVVAAAGNDGSLQVSYPAAYDNYVIAVGATRYDETLAYYSNYGASLDLVAPGGAINVDQNNDGYGDGVLQNTFNPNTKNTGDFGYWLFQGTSMAAPHVSGVAALLIAHGNASTPDEVRTALQETAKDLGATGRDDNYGWGLVDAYAALSWTNGPVDNRPTVSITSPLDEATVSGVVTIDADASDDVRVAQVDFYYGSTLIGTDETAPYSVTWDCTAVGDRVYTLTATAIDTASQEASDSINVTVDNVNDPPVANAGPDQTVSDADGTGVETIILNGSGSYDPDGSISSYEWAEGGALLETGKIISCDFAVGTHTITLTVTDDKGASASDECIINVVANQAPVGDAGPDWSAYVGNSVTFDGSSSFDPDGSIVSYDWDFGDGESRGGVTVSHAYSEAGTYTVTLTVADSGGLMSEDVATCTISEAPAAPIACVNIDLSEQSVWGRWVLIATVTITENDAAGLALAGAIVYANWSGAYSRTVSGTTYSGGKISFRAITEGSGIVTFTVTKIVKNGQEYILSGETSDCTAGPVNNPPVANAGPDQTVSDADGTGVETIILNGSGSYDPDGSISSYEWAEGGALLETGKIISCDFAVGTHTITLTVTDDKGASASDECIINVVTNQAPVGDAGPDRSAYVGNSVIFNGSSSFDPDGSIVSYDWDFGDGKSGSGVTVSHAYSEAGTYTVTLIVADNDGAMSEDTATVTISEAPAAPIAWVKIDLSKQSVRIYREVTATVTITENDSAGLAIAGAMVYGNWSGAHSGMVSGTSDRSGKLSFRTIIRESGIVTFTVTKIVKDGKEYILSGETSESI